MVSTWAAVLSAVVTGVLAWLWGHADGITRAGRLADRLAEYDRELAETFPSATAPDLPRESLPSIPPALLATAAPALADPPVCVCGHLAEVHRTFVGSTERLDCSGHLSRRMPDCPCERYEEASP
jgi:hypothetical protein